MGGTKEMTGEAGSTLRLISERLRRVSDTPQLDAQVLLARRMGRPRTWLLAHLEMQVDQSLASNLELDLKRLEAGEPLPYVLGEWEFFGSTFIVTPDVLIPRPETELLVERALHWLENRPGKCTGLDVGTGSGCIAISLLLHAPHLQMTATDISPAALKIAQQNSLNADVGERIQFFKSDLIPDDLCARYDLICANLPYIPSGTLAGLKVREYEPEIALDGGVDGLSLIQHLLTRAPDLLAPKGLLLIEIEAGQGEAVKSLACSLFQDADVRCIPDHAGHDRLIEVLNGCEEGSNENSNRQG